MCFHFLKLYQYHTWTSVRLVTPGGEGGADVLVLELFMPVCSDHAGMRHKVPKSSPLYRDFVPEISPSSFLDWQNTLGALQM